MAPMPVSPPQRPAAVVFDCDGLLLDTESAWTRAETTLYARHAVEFTLEHKREMLGTSGARSRAILERHLAAPGRGEELGAALRDLAVEELAHGAPPQPGAVELLEALRSRGTPVAVASNSNRRFLDLALEVSGLADRFDSILSAEEVPHPKPAPDIYAASCERLGAGPGDAVALEDSHTGVRSAVSAGLYVVGVPSLAGVELDEAHLVAASLEAPEVWQAVGLLLAA